MAIATTELLLARGAKPAPAMLIAAANKSESESTLRKLLAAGAKDKGDAAGMALRAGCFACLDALLPEHAALPRGLIYVSPVSAPGKPELVRIALEHGADVNARDIKGRTVLMLLAISQHVTPELVQTIIDRGADVHAKSKQGLNALDYAQRLGRQPIIDVLTRAGLQPTKPTSTPAPAAIRRQQLGSCGGSAQPAAAANQQQDVLRPRRLRWLSSQPADRHHGAGGATHGIHRGRDAGAE